MLCALLVVGAGCSFAFPVVAAEVVPAPDTILLSNSLAAVTRRDYDAEVSRLPADVREGFANNPRRVTELLTRMLMQKSLAAQARAAKLDTDPQNAARIAFETDRLLAAMEIDAVERAARAEFDANLERYETRARELYLVNKSAYMHPAEVNAAHILFDTTKKYASEDARRKAEEVRAKLVAGADFATLARELSDDRVSGEKGANSAGSSKSRWIRLSVPLPLRWRSRGIFRPRSVRLRLAHHQARRQATGHPAAVRRSARADSCRVAAAVRQ